MQAAAREQVEQLQELLLLDQVLDRGRIDRGHGNDRQGPINDQDPEDEKDAPADVRRTEGVDEGVEHRLGPACIERPPDEAAADIM